MSNRPGIGSAAVDVLVDALSSNHHADNQDDVPHQLKIGQKSIPLGRYLRAKLRERMGYTPEYIEALKDEFTRSRSLEMLALQKTHGALTVREAFIEHLHQKILQVEGRFKLYNQRKTL